MFQAFIQDWGGGSSWPHPRWHRAHARGTPRTRHVLVQLSENRTNIRTNEQNYGSCTNIVAHMCGSATLVAISTSVSNYNWN